MDSVLRIAIPERRGHGLAATIIAFGIHGAFWFWAQRADRFIQSSSTAPLAGLEIELLRDEPLDLVRPAPAPTPDDERKPQEPSHERARPQVHSTTRSRPDAAQLPAPAQAAAVVAQEPTANGPVDLTSEMFVVGTAAAPAGGVTAANGTNSATLRARETKPSSPPSAAGTVAPDYAGAVTLEQQNWSCPWPAEADLDQINEQTVVLRVVVNVAGNVESAAIVADPGHGFGQAAVTCALRTRFTPARDHEGKPVRAKSPPIRIRFTR